MTEVRNTQLARDREHSVAGQFFESVRAWHLRAERPRPAQVLVPARGRAAEQQVTAGLPLDYLIAAASLPRGHFAA